MKKEEYNFEQAIDIINQIVNEKGIKQKELEFITGAKQGNISKILKKEERNKDGSLKFFTVKQLVALSLEWGISVDELLGLKKETEPTVPTARDICEFIAKLEGQNAFFTTVEREEDCFFRSYCEFDNTIITEHQKVRNKYLAIAFSNWLTIPDPFDNFDLYSVLTDDGNECYNATCVNIFLSRLTKIIKMKRDGDLDEEMYNRLLKSYLDEVPDVKILKNANFPEFQEDEE